MCSTVSQRDRQAMTSIPIGYCQCGCGGKTQISVNNHAKRGYVKGVPFRFIANHHTYGSLLEYRVDDNGCWRWLRSMVGKYGRGPRKTYAHRFYYEKAKGKIPNGFQIDHLCKVTDCVNPSHLEAVTSLENIRRSTTTKLTSDEVAEIRSLREDGLLFRQIAKRFKVHKETVRSICRRKHWR